MHFHDQDLGMKATVDWDDIERKNVLLVDGERIENFLYLDQNFEYNNQWQVKKVRVLLTINGKEILSHFTREW